MYQWMRESLRDPRGPRARARNVQLYSCKDSYNQHFAYDEFSKKFALDFDYEDDVDQLCMGWDQLEDSSRVIATRCYEDRDPYDAQIYWKIL